MADRILACHLVIWLYLWLYFKLLLSFSVFYFLMGIFYILLLLNSIFQSQLKHCFSFPASCLYSDLTHSLHCLLEYQKFGKNYDRGFWNTFPPSVLPFTACNMVRKSNQSDFRTLHCEMFLELPPAIPTTPSIVLPWIPVIHFQFSIFSDPSFQGVSSLDLDNGLCLHSVYGQNNNDENTNSNLMSTYCVQTLL